VRQALMVFYILWEIYIPESRARIFVITHHHQLLVCK